MFVPFEMFHLGLFLNMVGVISFCIVVARVALWLTLSFITVPEGHRVVVRRRKHTRVLKPGTRLIYPGYYPCSVDWTSPFQPLPIVRDLFIPERILSEIKDSLVVSSDGATCAVLQSICFTVVDYVKAAHAGDVTRNLLLELRNEFRATARSMSAVDLFTGHAKLEKHMMNYAKSMDCQGLEMSSFAVLKVDIPESVVRRLATLAMFKALRTTEEELAVIESKELEKHRDLQLANRQHDVELKIIDAQVEHHKELDSDDVCAKSETRANELEIKSRVSKLETATTLLEALASFMEKMIESKMALCERLVSNGIPSSSHSTVVGNPELSQIMAQLRTVLE